MSVKIGSRRILLWSGLVVSLAALPGAVPSGHGDGGTDHRVHQKGHQSGVVGNQLG